MKLLRDTLSAAQARPQPGPANTSAGGGTPASRSLPARRQRRTRLVLGLRSFAGIPRGVSIGAPLVQAQWTTGCETPGRAKARTGSAITGVCGMVNAADVTPCRVQTPTKPRRNPDKTPTWHTGPPPNRPRQLTHRPRHHAQRTRTKTQHPRPNPVAQTSRPQLPRGAAGKPAHQAQGPGLRHPACQARKAQEHPDEPDHRLKRQIGQPHRRPHKP